MSSNMDIFSLGQSILASLWLRLKACFLGAKVTGAQASVTLLVACLSFMSVSTVADDTELYVYEASSRTGARPQVLIIFDNSGSMGNEVTDVDQPYQKKSAGRGGSTNLGQTGTLYYTRGASDSSSLPNPDNSRELRKFSGNRNGCESSWEYLNEYGSFTGYFRHYGFKGGSGSWQELPKRNGKNVSVIDCFEDIQDEKYGNIGSHSGLPVDSLGTKNNPVIYTTVYDGSNKASKDKAKKKAELTKFGTGSPITLYTEDYLKWHHGPKTKVDKTRLELAQDAIESVILTTPGVDFGLAIFNLNGPYEGDRNGGRIISGIKSMSANAKINLLKSVDNIKYGQNTPLCETLYEAYRYFGGQSVEYGDDDSDHHYYDRWGRYLGTYSASKNASTDPEALDPNTGRYQSPFKDCQNEAYIVYITDGEPTVDGSADVVIEQLTGGVDKYPGSQVEPRSQPSNLSALASWMNNNDVNSTMDGKQTVKTFTVGFSEGASAAAPLLQLTAQKGGGKYFDATDASKLRSSLQTALSNILEKNASFTSPSVASNNFNRTQTFDSAYYSMFLPNKGPRWLGNIKKFRVTGDGDVVDRNGNNAIGEDGNIKSDACSYWTPTADCSGTSGDGNDVKLGGILSAMQSADSRTLFGNFGRGLKPLTLSNAAGHAGGQGSLASYMGVAESELIPLFQWAKGLDVDNDKGQELAELTSAQLASNWRLDIMGDALHSKPLALNFGTEASPDIRIIVGTNHGFLHMFKDEGASVSESWGFMPYELLPNLGELRTNQPSGVHSVYGIDGTPVAYTKMNGSKIEKAWVFFGMRRGGSSYYALDITAPDSPKYMWRIDSSSLGFGELGQSWSTPIVTTIPGNGGNPVLIFGAGYSPSTKDGSELSSVDTQGRGVYIVNAADGKLVHHFGVTGKDVTPLPGIEDSIPSSVAVLDSDSDGISDRIYATDTNGNVWRMDMPSSDVTKWSGFKFASLGDKSSVASNRRFYSGPVLAQTIITNTHELSTIENGKSKKIVTTQNIPYDAVVVGSGHRAMPSDKKRSDMFFALQDRNVVTRSFKGDTSQNTPPAALDIDTLYNVSTDAPKGKAENLAFGKKRGWYYDFSRLGEKNLSSAVIIEGRVYFTTFAPGGGSAVNQCLTSGQGYLYNFGLHKGTKTYELDAGEVVLDTPQLVIPPNKPKNPNKPDDIEPSAMYLIGVGKAVPKTAICDNGNVKCVGDGVETHKIYYYTNG
ncbi:pilus assembly protein [Shewanella colwelliana]|uniref:pilus assembly protein n=1 Tax=Shewanella colwelliana TaxID=23 RepID=UPI002180D4F9|nr:PilC/PilY family type IV pilus protein [Shewanella colwelliana]